MFATESDLSTLKQSPAQRKAMLKKNAAFGRLSKKAQRIQIAEDVLKLLRLKKITPGSTYLDLGNSVEAIDPEIPESCQLSHVIEEGVGCHVCGIGSLFISAVTNHNHLTIKKFEELSQKDDPDSDWDDDTLGPRGAEVAYLKKWFSSEQLDLVEDYFENATNSYEWELAWDSMKQNERLRLIMRNIIGNKGIFDPTKGPGKTKFPQPRAKTEDEDS